MKPSAVPSIHPIVRQQEAQQPYEQDTIVEDGTPEQCFTYYRDAHEPSPTCLLPLRAGLLVRLCYTPLWQHKQVSRHGIHVEWQCHWCAVCAAQDGYASVALIALVSSPSPFCL